MKTLSAAIVLSLSFLMLPAPHGVLGQAVAHEEEMKGNVPKHLQDISVTIRAGSAEGSGVAFVRDGITYIWTAAHVVDGLRNTREVIDPKTGTKRTVIEFRDAKVIKTLVDNGRTVGRIEMDAEVIRYSDFVHGEDLCLLRVRKKGFIKESAKFYLDSERLVPLGTRLYHVGSLLGSTGSNSMTSGIMSQHGRLIAKKVYDQTTVTAFPGSSGGGVYLTDGRYMGMLVRGAGEGFNLIVPARRLCAWAKRAGVEWAIDHRVKMPPKDELERMPIEDIGGKSSKSPDGKKFPYLINNKET